MYIYIYIRQIIDMAYICGSFYNLTFLFFFYLSAHHILHVNICNVTKSDPNMNSSVGVADVELT